MSEFGRQLKEAREGRGISLREVATATKISVSVLESLESGDFSRLPGGIFSRAFVRSFAVEVGLNGDEIVEQFIVEMAAAVPAANEIVRPEVTDDDLAFLEKQRTAWIVLRVALVVLAVIVVAGFVWWRMSSVPEQ